jgi:hypothetical protein
MSRTIATNCTSTDKAVRDQPLALEVKAEHCVGGVYSSVVTSVARKSYVRIRGGRWSMFNFFINYNQASC